MPVARRFHVRRHASLVTRNLLFASDLCQLLTICLRRRQPALLALHVVAGLFRLVHAKAGLLLIAQPALFRVKLGRGPLGLSLALCHVRGGSLLLCLKLLFLLLALHQRHGERLSGGLLLGLAGLLGLCGKAALLD